VQCETGVCWCADPKTGGIQDETMAVPESLWTYLPCCEYSFESDLKLASIVRREATSQYLIFRITAFIGFSHATPKPHGSHGISYACMC
jgi:hypothetical protein